MPKHLATSKIQRSVLNLLQLRNLKSSGTDFAYVVELRKAVDRVKKDIIENNNIQKHAGGPRDQLVDLEQVLSYI